MSEVTRDVSARRIDSAAPASHTVEWVLGKTSAVRRVAEKLERAAEAQCTVLIAGETGTGKEVMATLLHGYGPRSQRPFVPVNCAALTATLAESQLFGHEKGSFTGAAGSSLGVFRAAEGGVVFLDEVGEMPLELQPKLLRVLQEGEVTPVGASRPVKIDVQVIAATNRELEAEVQAGRFRRDLYYRLNMIELVVPPLRERKEDIPEFVSFFSQRFARQYDRPTWQPSAETLDRFSRYAWPGNVRQLAHLIEQAYVLDCEPALPELDAADAGPLAPQAGAVCRLPSYNLERLRELAIREALLATGGRKGRAAKLLGIHANTLTRLLAQLDIAVTDH